MNCLDDLNESKEKWFHMEGGGKVQFRSVPISIYRDIQKKTVREVVDYKKVEGTPSRLPYEKVNQDLQTRLFWDYAIVSWDEFSYRNPETKELVLCTPETCTADNKFILITCSKKFVTFANECMKALEDDGKVQAETEAKNSVTGSSSPTSNLDPQ